MTPVYKLSASSITGRTTYGSMLAGNTAYNPSVYDSIASTTVGAGGAATINFTGITNSYRHLVLRGSIRTTDSTSNPNYRVQVNGDTGTNYDFGLALNTSGQSGQNYSFMYGYKNASASQTAGYFSPFLLEFFDYANTNFHKTARFYSGTVGETSSAIAVAGNTWRNTAAISSILIYLNIGNFAEHSVVSLYGIRG